MCGIVGAVAKRNIVPILLEGLRKLEYRGYDSAGIAVVNGGLHRLRSIGRVASLAEMADQAKVTAISASHTPAGPRTAFLRSATPIRISAKTALRSFTTASSRITKRCAHGLRRRLSLHLRYRHRSRRASDSPTWKREWRLAPPSHRAVSELRGAYAIAVLSEKDPDTLVVARKGAPLLLGLGKGENFCRVRHFRAAPGHQADCLSRRRRCGRDRIERRAHLRQHRQRRSSDGARKHVVRRRGRARAVPSLHAEGNLRAAGGGRQYARDGHRRPIASCRSCSASRPRR